MSPPPTGTVGADPDALDLSASRGAGQAAALARARVDVRLACGRYVAGTGSTIDAGAASAGLARAGWCVARHDRWVTRVAAALRRADRWPGPHTRALLVRVADGTVTPADHALAAAVDRWHADGDVPVAVLVTLDDAGLGSLGRALPPGTAAADAVAREQLRRSLDRVDAALAAAVARAGPADRDDPVERWLRWLDGHDLVRGVEMVGDPIPTVDDEVRRLRGRRDAVRRLLDEPGLRLAAVDLGDPLRGGALLAVRGDLDRATRVALLVPGTGTGLDDTASGLADTAWLHRGAGERTATAVWFHPAPADLPTAADPDVARGLAPAAARATARVASAAADGARVTLVGHSHGAVVLTATAAGTGLEADALALLGPPGLGPAPLGEVLAGLRPGARVHVAMAPDDPVRLVPLLHDLTGGAAGHGPSALVPGVQRLPTEAVPDPDRAELLPPPTRGHEEYLRPGPTLTAVTALVAGPRRPPVEGTSATTDHRRPGATRR